MTAPTNAHINQSECSRAAVAGGTVLTARRSSWKRKKLGNLPDLSENLVQCFWEQSTVPVDSAVSTNYHLACIQPGSVPDSWACEACISTGIGWANCRYLGKSKKSKTGVCSMIHKTVPPWIMEPIRHPKQTQLKLTIEIGSSPGCLLHAGETRYQAVIIQVFNVGPTVREILQAHWKTAEGPLAVALKEDLMRSITLGFKMAYATNQITGLSNFDIFLDIDDQFLISINPCMSTELRAADD
ncbi:hypothetical protein B0H17DRAFT_1153886 [Mycena rosella]|uniref:Uncharacterized protein n=1 Tax=Mycena rosella TaxID=1033263 RepID=A0AAD7B1I9_MYCRO|nr:hypothetical protein B0H17DRAFT_1153886 [Mycena rosella]